MLKNFERSISGILLVAMCVACGGSTQGAKHPVKKRAPFDLHCSASELEFERLDDKTIGVSGCGKRATYVEVCRQTLDGAGTFFTGVAITDEECQWHMDSRGR